MKKGILTILSLLLMAGSVLGSDRVLFKMYITHSSDVAVNSLATLDLASYAFIIGGSAEVKNGQNSDGVKVLTGGCTRLTTTAGYFHITLDRALRAGDVISYTNASIDSNKMLVTTTSTRGGSINVEPNGDGYTIPAASGLIGATELYFWYGTSISSATYLKSLTITTTSEEVAYYDFENETVETFAKQAEVTLVNGLRVNSNLESGRSSIISQSIACYTKMLNIAGTGINRALKLAVTDPCDIEVWAIGAAASRSLYITDDASDLDKSTLYTTTEDNKTSLVRSTYRFDGYADNTDLIISPSAGGWKIVAIRVIYDRIRPDANFSVSPASALLKAGESQLFTFNKDYDGATISRSAGEGSESAWITKAAETANESITMRAKADGVGHTYVMRLTQVADAHCRQAVVDVPIRIIAANESVLDIDGAIAPLSNDVWESNGITLIEDGKNNNGIARYGSTVGEFAANSSLRLAAGRTFTLSVPTNKQIARLTISGYTVGGNAGDKGSITPEGGSATQFNGNGGDIKVIEYTDINAQKFTFAISGKNVAVKIDLVTTDLGYYPVTVSHGWASFCAPEDVELPSGVDAYIVDDTEADALYIKDAEVTTIPANTGVLLYSESDGDYHLTATTGAADLSSGFAGTIARTANPNTSTTYSLYDNNGTIEFWNYTGNYIPANKAYLVYAGAGAPGRTLRVQVRPKVPTAAESIQNSDIRSQKVIANGQLVIIREGVKYNVVGQIVK